MDILNDKKNATVVVVIAVLAIGGATLSCIHFLSGPPPIPRIVAPSGSEPQNIGTDLIRPPGSAPVIPQQGQSSGIP